MYKQMMMAATGLMLLVAGCATKPGYVGTWKADKNLPEKDMESMTLYLTEGGGFMFKAQSDDRMEGGSGGWTNNGLGGIRIWVEGENDEAQARLLDDDILLLTADGMALEFTRQ